MNLADYGFDPTMLLTADLPYTGIPARITAVHKERYELVCEYGSVSGKLKTGIYFHDGAEDFPTTGDFVLISHNPSGGQFDYKDTE